MGCCVVEKQLSFECIISALAQTSLGFIRGWGREVALLEGRNVAEAIDAATNYPPSSKGGSRAATSGDEKNAAKNYANLKSDEILFFSFLPAEQHKRGKRGVAIHRCILRLFELSNFINDS